jgi:hypothetical protein
MSNSTRLCRVLGALMAASFGLPPANVDAAPVLRRGDIRIAFPAPASCDVTMALTVEGGVEIDHRVEVMPGTRVILVEMRGASQVGDLRTVGRTQSLVVRTEGAAYQLHYRVQQPNDRADRCPLWLPIVPTEGRPDAIRLEVALPPSTAAASSFPAFTWSDTHGVATLAHVPAFVRARYVAAGEPPPWDITRTMDAMALVAFAAATGLWMRYRRR